MDTAQGERGRFAGLLMAQIVFILVIPFVEDSGTGRWFLRLSVLAIVLAGVNTARSRRGTLAVSLMLLLPTLFAWLGPGLFTEHAQDLLRMLSTALCFGFTAGVVVHALMRQKQVSTDTILGGINAYLLVAYAFMFMHSAINMVDGGAYTIGGVPLGEHLRETSDVGGNSTLLYFSFTTLTTLGYGDIVPVDEFARLLTSIEAVLGQLYVAIFIGRLVALQVSAPARPEDA